MPPKTIFRSSNHSFQFILSPLKVGIIIFILFLTEEITTSTTVIILDLELKTKTAFVCIRIFYFFIFFLIFWLIFYFQLLGLLVYSPLCIHQFLSLNLFSTFLQHSLHPPQELMTLLESETRFLLRIRNLLFTRLWTRKYVLTTFPNYLHPLQ